MRMAALGVAALWACSSSPAAPDRGGDRLAGDAGDPGGDPAPACPPPASGPRIDLFPEFADAGQTVALDFRFDNAKVFALQFVP